MRWRRREKCEEYHHWTPCQRKINNEDGGFSENLLAWGSVWMEWWYCMEIKESISVAWTFSWACNQENLCFRVQINKDV